MGSQSQGMLSQRLIYLNLGRILATPAALQRLEESEIDPSDLLRRHQRGDWGQLTSDDLEQNDLAAGEGLRVLSNYPLPNGGSVWIITEADRSVTTLLLPSEY